MTEFRVCSPVPVMLAGGRMVVCGEPVDVDPKRNKALIDAGLLVEQQQARHHAPRRRPTHTKEQ